MHVGDERGIPQRFATELDKRTYIQAFKDGIDSNTITILQTVGKTYRETVSQYDFHLNVWHAERLDRVLNPRISVELVLERSLPPSLWQEVVQLGVEAKRSPVHEPILRSTRQVEQDSLPLLGVSSELLTGNA